MKVIDRQVYNFLDYIGDIGGLGEGLFFTSYALLAIINYGLLDNQIIQELFKVRKGQADASTGSTQRLD